MIEIDERQLDGKPKKVGTLHGKPVLLFRTKGGFYMNVIMKNGAPEWIGTGPHAAVCRYVSKLREPEVVWTELSKSDWVDPAHFTEMIPKYQELTDRCNELYQLNK